MVEAYNLDDLFNFRESSSQQSSQLINSVTNTGPTTSSFPDYAAPSAAPNRTPRVSSLSPYAHQTKLTFMQEEEWDPN
ncbi:uncharacterized protein Z519_12639 [Cladophialophora bantiana CBS 173.52]|uniref:Uncharacterized protein n=1 Tax=Cladophialophora bantiana (strain ATCC 10958 / CBS 173.52 / CDC B-1940 / NIH 8579) TaxID=1442370 RepID=A0A0D2E9B6_CLAB1|nr:uncharacterized protein Z519_12639 [Cladophialophora bantiana CBS 173.52]KIW86726.1 hypothetical protein Z519_12639 [Cladophialophora bantiana CBS 173.52]